MDSSDPAATSRVPMTVIGGYLGSGKTTLINQLLGSDSGLRIAVIVNDFGAIPIDSALLKARSSAVLELSNGCVCCDLSEGMSAVLDRIRALPERPDHIVVEVSGVGDPAAVAAWADHPGFRRHGVVVCADAATVQDRAADRWSADTVRAQLRGADVLLVTKSDLVTADRNKAVRSWLGTTVSGVPIVDNAARLIDLLISPLPAIGVGRDRKLTHEPQAHPDYLSWSASTDAVVSMQQVREFLAALPSEVVRAKGVLRTNDRPDRRTVVHLVAGRIDTYDDGPWRSRDRHSELVLIAAGSLAPDSDIERRLHVAISPSATTSWT